MIRYAPASGRHLLQGFRGVESDWWHSLGEVNAKLALVTASAADGLALIMQALPERGEVVIPAYTCERVVSAVFAAGDVPRFVDVDPGSGSIDYEGLLAALDRSPKAVVLTHLFGIDIEADRVIAAASSRGVPVIEDRALLVDARPRLSSASLASIYSFGRGKPLPLGGAGAVATGNDEFATRLKGALSLFRAEACFGLGRLTAGLLRDCRLSLELSAIAGRVGLRASSIAAGSSDISSLLIRRPTQKATLAIQSGVMAAVRSGLIDGSKAAAIRYAEAFAEAGVATQGRIGSRLPNGTAVPVLALRSPERDQLVSRLAKAGIDCPRYWTFSVADAMGHTDFPGARQLARELLFLPLHRHVGIAGTRRIARLLRGHQLTAFN